MPDRDLTWDDLVRGEITFGKEHVPDYVLVRGNGEPLYTLVNPVDDALMRITHVLRGEDLLSSTPRQIALYEALAAIGVSDGTTPRFGHLPYVMGEGNRKLSKRDPESALQMYRDQGYLPEALLNYLALLGWSMGDDQEFFGKEQMAEHFTLNRVNPNPARFDLKKCTAINGDWIRELSGDDLIDRIVPFLVDAYVIDYPPTADQQAVLRAAVPLVQERMETLSQSVGMLAFLLVPSERFEVDAADAEAVLSPESMVVIDAAVAALDGLDEWTTPAIEEALRSSLIDGLGLKPKVAFGPVRVAVTGRRVSPPLFESIEILGKMVTIARLGAVRRTI
jgi:glutamyl-tRNA synthetase